ncbi:hypothetical protein [Botrimarina mediterranea]|uniref:hypothetical protein n=1 Tax=Botrimarina mediterranea TaxID=2528022 RepID=UPI003AF32756
MMTRLLALLLAASTASLAVADRPTLYDVVGRLTKPTDASPWRLTGMSEPDDLDAGDSELQLRHESEPVGLYVDGPRAAVRSVTATVGPVDIDTAEGKRALAAGASALALASGVDVGTIRSWLLENRDALRAGSFGKPSATKGLRISGIANKTDRGLELMLSTNWDAAPDPPEPADGLARLEAITKKAANWSAEAVRCYRHSSGVCVTFDEDRQGPRMVVEYTPAQKAESEMVAGIWVLLATLGRGDAEIEENHDRIVEWMKAPKSSLQLRRGLVKFREGEDGKLVLTVRQSP